MITLELTPEEADALRALLSDALADLRSEIHHTDNRNFRVQLQARAALLQQVLQHLGEATT